MIESLTVVLLAGLCIGPMISLFCWFKDEQAKTALKASETEHKLELIKQDVLTIEKRVLELEDATVLQNTWDKKMKEAEDSMNSYLEKVQL